MLLPEKIETFVVNLPDAESARRFYLQISEKKPSEAKKLYKNEALLSDILTLVSYSPLLAATLLQNPNYISWLNRQRLTAKTRGKEEILESLARFALVNSQLEPNVLLARFRRRELLRIYLNDIRGLGTIAEITEEISNLADAILEYALRLSQQELDNRYGTPLETDDKNRAAPSRFSIVALGKLGSGELNYASDIDLLFIYSKDGTTSGGGARGAVTNREYYVKLAEFVTRLVGGQSGEGAAYRVDLRLRPHGRVGALAVSLDEAVNYYQSSAQNWERQVLIRARAGAGDSTLFHKFYSAVKSSVFSGNETVENALENVRLSKEKINFDKSSEKSFNVKLGRGGIREIEFIAQALQLAYGGDDEWLRAPHTLISLSRLADRNLLTESETTELFDAYDFLRRAEHRLQMENGLQTHLVPLDAWKRELLARRMNFRNLSGFDDALETHSGNVNRIFKRVFDVSPKEQSSKLSDHKTADHAEFEKIQPPQIIEKDYKLPIRIRASLEKSNVGGNLDEKVLKTLETAAETSAHFVEMIASNPNLIEHLPNVDEEFKEVNYREILIPSVAATSNFAEELAVLRKNWARFYIEIVTSDVHEKITTRQSRNAQTKLAQASIEAALFITRRELERRFARNFPDAPLAVLGLGKLGGGGMDYDSDLDLILIYDDRRLINVEDLTPAEFYSRAVEIFVTAISSLTREGQLYRVDLRLRPDGKNGATSLGVNAFMNYLKNRAAIWELLAYVKIRGAAGDFDLAKTAERKARKIIHGNARKISVEKLKTETRRIRELLEKEKTRPRDKREINIKFGAGGMLDVYFAARYLQLRDDVPDESEDRSTRRTLETLYEKGSLSKENYQSLNGGYQFLTELDHNLRLTVGRSTRLPLANINALQTIAVRMKLDSVKDFTEKLTFHRLDIRETFDNIFDNRL